MDGHGPVVRPRPPRRGAGHAGRLLMGSSDSLDCPAWGYNICKTNGVLPQLDHGTLPTGHRSCLSRFMVPSLRLRGLTSACNSCPGEGVYSCPAAMRNGRCPRGIPMQQQKVAPAHRRHCASETRRVLPTHRAKLPAKGVQCSHQTASEAAPPAERRRSHSNSTPPAASCE